MILYSNQIQTPIGEMLAICDDKNLFLLEFVERPNLQKEIDRLKKHFDAGILFEKKGIISTVEKELLEYFEGKREKFSIPLFLLGTDFQKQVWNELIEIPSGETLSYKKLATKTGRDTASRAVARANATNQIAIMIPCHRIICSDGKLGGYAGGLSRKEWLLEHEKKCSKNKIAP